MARKMPDPVGEGFEYSRGANVTIVKPEEGFEPRVPCTWEKFVKLMTTFTISESKTGEYVSRPMGGDGSRTDANAEPWPLLPLDLDEMLPEDLSDLKRWCEEQGLDLVMVTTFSHTAEEPRIRLWVRCSRPFSATEHLFLFKAFNSALVFPFKLDPATAKPSQPIYLPRCPDSRRSIAFAHHYPGAALNVDGMLRGYQAEMRERERRNEGGRFSEGKGVRVPGGMVDSFNKHFDLHGLIEEHGYKRKTRNRYTAPSSKSGRAAVTIHDWGLISFHDPEHDPLSVRNDLNLPRVLDPFAVYAILEHHDEFIPAWKAAAQMVRTQGWGDDEPTVGSAELNYEILSVPESIRRLRPREMVVKNLIERESLILAVGHSNSGKTTVLEYLAFCVAMGLPFGPHETRRGKVLWIAGEDQYNSQLRFAAMCTECGVRPAELLDWLYILPLAISVLDKRSMATFHEAVDKCGAGSFALVFIDSKSACWGGDDENSNDENAAFVRSLNSHFVTPYGASVLVMHHLTKHKEKEEQTARGASSLVNNMDHEWHFELRSTNNIVVLEPGTKLRIARWSEMRFAIKVVELSGSEYPHLVDSQGDLPKVSVAAVTNVYGINTKRAQDDAEFFSILVEMVKPGYDAKARKKPHDFVARSMGKIVKGASVPDMNAARDWVRHRIKRLIEQKLVDKDNAITSAGRQFIEQYEVEQQVTDDAATEREPGEDDE